MDITRNQGGKDRVGGESNLKNWIHKTRVEEVVDEMLEGL